MPLTERNCVQKLSVMLYEKPGERYLVFFGHGKQRL